MGWAAGSVADIATHRIPPPQMPLPLLPTLTNVLLRCRVSVRTTSVSQFLTLRKRGHLEGLPFLVGDCFPEVGGCEGEGK